MPAGVPTPDETVATRVTVLPSWDGFGVALSAVDVGAVEIVSARVALVLGL